MDEESTGLFLFFNPNPRSQDPAGKIDCVVRAFTAAFDWTWERAYAALSIQGFLDGDNFALDSVWGNFLAANGWQWQRIPDTCPRCYTAAEFAKDHPQGIWILGTGSHAVCVRDGQIWDSWRSENVVPLFAWKKPESGS